MRVLSADRLPPSIRPANNPTAEQCEACSARHIGMCDALSDANLSVLARVAQRVVVRAGKAFIEEGNPAQYFYDLTRGDVRVFKALADGRRQITGFMGVGQFLGLAVGGKYAFTAEALNEVQLCRFDRLAIKSVFDEFPVLERRLLDVATHELVAAQEQMLLLGRKSALERVVSFLLNWARTNDADAGVRVLTLPMSRLDLADYLGLTIETVSRSMGQMKRDGLISFSEARSVTLLELGRLKAIDAGET